jgi:hypothetical protein
MENETKLIAIPLLFGAAIGFAQVLAKGKPFDWRLAVARSILNGALGVGSAFALVIFPTMSLPAVVGLACILASLGTSAIERLFQRVLGGTSGGQ